MDKRKIGVKFGAYHTYEEWGLRLADIKIGMPVPKKVLVDVPGGDGVLDLSKSLTGDIQYNTRQLEFTFDARNCNYFTWPDLLSDICDKLHGICERIVLDTDKSYYYDGMIEVSSEKSNETTAKIVITAECQPYKMELFSSIEDWEWDSFDFEDGIIREYKNMRVDNSLTLVIEGRRKSVIPSITVVSDNGSGLQVKFAGKTYNLPDGTTRIVNISTKAGANTLLFTGNGTVSVDYRGGRL